MMKFQIQIGNDNVVSEPQEIEVPKLSNQMLLVVKTARFLDKDIQTALSKFSDKLKASISDPDAPIATLVLGPEDSLEIIDLSTTSQVNEMVDENFTDIDSIEAMATLSEAIDNMNFDEVEETTDVVDESVIEDKMLNSLSNEMNLKFHVGLEEVNADASINFFVSTDLDICKGAVYLYDYDGRPSDIITDQLADADIDKAIKQKTALYTLFELRTTQSADELLEEISYVRDYIESHENVKLNVRVIVPGYEKCMENKVIGREFFMDSSRLIPDELKDKCDLFECIKGDDIERNLGTLKDWARNKITQ